MLTLVQVFKRGRGNIYRDLKTGRFTFGPGRGNKVADLVWLATGKTKLSLDGRYIIEPSGKKSKLIDSQWHNDSLLKFPYVKYFDTEANAKREANDRLEIVRDY